MGSELPGVRTSQHRSPIPTFPKGKEFHQRPIQTTTSPIPAFPKGGH